MATTRRPSGITVETNGPVEAVTASGRSDDTGPVLTPPRPGRRRGRPTRKGARRAPGPRTQAIPDEGDLIAQALVDSNLKLIDAVPLQVAPAAPGRRRPGRRKGATAADETTGQLVGTADIGVPLAPNERAVVLLEQDGVYSWHTPQVEEQPVASDSPSGKRKKKAAKTATKSSKRVVHFRLQIAAVQAPPRRPGRRKFGFIRKMVGKAVAYVFRIIAKPLVGAVARWLEKDVAEGLVHITGTDPAAWSRDGDQSVTIPAGRPAKVLLFVHGTFSSTMGSFGSLGATDAGKAFLTTAFTDYDFVIGWDHRTLSVSPLVNATDLLDWFEAQRWPKPPVIDAIAFSRGGLVLRTLVEDLLPDSPFKGRVNRAVFVACTNGGTELARPENWNRFADRYINVAAAGVRALAFIPGFSSGSAILSEAIRGVGGLVKVLANVIVDDNAIPGMAAMNPAGPFVTRLNTHQPGQPAPDDVWYGAITSNFDPDKAAVHGNTQEVPPGWLLKLSDKGADALHGKPNDLVVHVEAMTQIDVDVGVYVREKLDYGTNGTVHHCRYFREPDTADALARWLKN